MGLFSKENCIICRSEVGALNRTKMDDGSYICSNCVAKVGISNGYTLNALKSSSIDDIKKRMEYVENDIKENSNRISQFKSTYQVGGYIWFDDEHKWFVLPRGTFTSKIDKSYVFKYQDLVDFEVLEDGTSITKGGLGKALVGGAIFGLAGAIAGGSSKKTKQICNKLQVKITTRNIDRPIVYIDLINTEFKKDGLVYKQASKSVQEILSKFQLIVDQLESESSDTNTSTSINISAADEIKKYKELLDMGAITQEEFDKKKLELLNM